MGYPNEQSINHYKCIRSQTFGITFYHTDILQPIDFNSQMLLRIYGLLFNVNNYKPQPKMSWPALTSLYYWQYISTNPSSLSSGLLTCLLFTKNSATQNTTAAREAPSNITNADTMFVNPMEMNSPEVPQSDLGLIYCLDILYRTPFSQSFWTKYEKNWPWGKFCVQA